MITLRSVGATYGGLAGKSGRDFGRGTGQYVTFTEVMAAPRLVGRLLDRVDVRAGERQNEVRRGDVLFNASSETPEEVALGAVVDFDVPRRVYLNSFCFGYRLARRDLVDPTYLAYFFRSAVGRRVVFGLAQGATRYNIAKTKLLDAPLDLPSLAEQKAVTEVLTGIDDLIVQISELITKKRSIKDGMMQELLTGRTRLSGFTGEWSQRELSTFGVFLRGRGIKREQVRPSGIPCIRYGELYSCYTDYALSTASFVEPPVAAAALPIRQGDILFAGSGETKEEIGKCVAYLGGVSAVAGGDIIVLRGSGFDPVYLASLLNTPRVANQKARGGQGDAVVHINWRVLAGLKVTVPSLPEQQAIAQVVRDADSEIAALERRLDGCRAIKQGLMQELLTGRTRLVRTGT